MGAVAYKALEHGAKKVTGIFPKCFSGCSSADGRLHGKYTPVFNDTSITSNLTEVITEDLHDRKKMLLEADVFICLPGGLGTLDEVTEVMAANDIARHTDENTPLREIIIVNIDGFFDGLRQQMEQSVKSGFISGNTLAMLHFADTAKDALDMLDGFDSREARRVAELVPTSPEPSLHIMRPGS